MAEPAPVKSQVKETLVSIIIAFALAFVFRAFVIEAFVIPTGSMAPTLLGAHMRFTGPATGANWAVNLPEGGGPYRTLELSDPISREPVSFVNPSRRSGDRILVFKYLYSLYDPQRWDAVVFKAPTQPQTNYIKRLIGLPGEQLALVDGDVFTRVPPPGEQPPRNPWSSPGWRIARKPERVQRAVWQTLHDTRYAPLPVAGVRPSSPWTRSGDWRTDGTGAAFACDAGGPAALHWDTLEWPINDWYPYNQVTLGERPRAFPVSDLRMRCGVQPEGPGLLVEAVIRARGHDFRARIDGPNVTLAIRPIAEVQRNDDGWRTLAQATLPAPLAPGRITPIEFWHVDQSLQLWIDGDLGAHAEYDWSVAERLVHATGLTPEDVLGAYQPDQTHVLMIPTTYSPPTVTWSFAGDHRPGFVLYAVGLDRDLFYQPSGHGKLVDGAPVYYPAARATHPANTPQLGPDHFFVCGDNSPQSEDARLWGDPDAWVKQSIDATLGVVPRDLLIGKAFFVYFPSLIKDTRSSIPVPDFGRMRFIW